MWKPTHKPGNAALQYFLFPLSHLVGLAEEGVGSAALVDDVSDQVLLAVVGGQDADAVGGVAQQAHVHVEGN